MKGLEPDWCNPDDLLHTLAPSPSYYPYFIQKYPSVIQLLCSAQGTIRALQMLKEERLSKERASETELRRRALQSGDNPDEVTLRKKREKEFDEKKREFESNRRQKHLEIVSKLLEEEKKKKKSETLSLKSHWHGRWVSEGAGGRPGERGRGRGRKRERGNEKRLEEEEEVVEQSFGDGERESETRGRNERRSDSEDEKERADDGVISESGEREEEVVDSEEVFARPEIDGLWNKTTQKRTDERRRR